MTNNFNFTFNVSSGGTGISNVTFGSTGSGGRSTGVAGGGGFGIGNSGGGGIGAIGSSGPPPLIGAIGGSSGPPPLVAGSNNPAEIIRDTAIRLTGPAQAGPYVATPNRSVWSSVMPGSLLPTRDPTRSPFKYVLFYNPYVNFDWDQELDNWMYIGVDYVGGPMDGRYGFCFYTGVKYSVSNGGSTGNVNVPFAPTDLVSQEEKQGIYNLQGHGYVWGWLYRN